MIRSNPTGIPLRASDIKLLQAEIDKRKSSSSSSTTAATATAGTGTGTSAGASSKEPATGAGAGAGATGDNSFVFPTTNDNRRDGRSIAERIGLEGSGTAGRST